MGDQTDILSAQHVDKGSPCEKVPINSTTVNQEQHNEAVDKLAEGLLSLYEPHLRKMKCQLGELTKKQETVIEQLEKENERFVEAQANYNLQDMFTQVKVYQGKLLTIKKDMAHMYERSSKLKKRALKLQAQKQKEALQKEQQRERELQREQQLIAKPSKKS